MPIPEVDRRRLALGLLAVALAGCGGQRRAPDRAAAPLPASYIPLTVGRGPLYRPGLPPPSGRRSIVGLPCSPRLGPRVGVHVELFAHRHVVLIPPGIGVQGPVRVGPVGRSGRCFAPLVTLAPTGVVELRPATRPLTLGRMFALWGQPLGPKRLAGFAGNAVHAFVDGRPVAGDPADIELCRHAEIVLETSGYVVPHVSYGFADGL